MFHIINNYGVCGRAIKHDKARIHLFNPRDFTTDKHRTVDDKPYGGGAGMLMKIAPLKKAIAKARQESPKGSSVVYLSPQGALLKQEKVLQLAKKSSIILVCGRYEGIDERLIIKEIDEEISIGDYILSGGELPAMTLIDSIIRSLPGCLGNPDSIQGDSFSNGLLAHPQYTRPENFEGNLVPSILLSGNHEKIRQWRLKETLKNTYLKRPDLLDKKKLTQEEALLLDQCLKEIKLNFNK